MLCELTGDPYPEPPKRNPTDASNLEATPYKEGGEDVEKEDGVKQDSDDQRRTTSKEQQGEEVMDNSRKVNICKM